MLNEFIEKILVHERDRKGSIQTTQEVEIYFNFVGRFVPSAFGEVELARENWEIRKREERKGQASSELLSDQRAQESDTRTKSKRKRRKSSQRKPPFVQRRTLPRACLSLSAVTAERRADERSTNSMNITYTQNGDYLIRTSLSARQSPSDTAADSAKRIWKCTARYCCELVLSDDLF